MSLPKSDAKEIEEIIGSIKQNFQCPICLELMLNPVSTKCDHKFCRHCILEVISRKSSAPCPLCKAPVTKRSLQDLIEWKNFVEKVKQLVDAFKLDLAEEHVAQECTKSADVTGVPIPSPSVFSVQEGTASTNDDFKRRRSVRFKVDGKELNSTQDKDTEVEQISVGPVGSNSSVRCLEGIEITSPTNKTSFVTSDTPQRVVSKKTNCLRNEFSETGIKNNGAAKRSPTGVEPASSGEEDEDDDNHGLITGGYQGEGDVDMEMRPAAENHKIFRSRALSKDVKPVEEKSTGVQSMNDDPYAFVGSQPTPKRKKSVQRKEADGVHMFEDFNVLPKRRKRMSLGGRRSALHLPSAKKTVTEVSERTGGEYCHEMQAMSDKLSAAEGYNLVLSQQFKDTSKDTRSVENKKSQKHLEHSSATRNLASVCNKILPFSSTENREQMQKNCSTFLQKDNEAIQIVPLKSGETVQKKLVPNKMTPLEAPSNRAVPKKAVPKLMAPHNSVLKVHEVEPNETVPSKICNKLIPIEALPEEDVVPNKLTPCKTAPNEVLSKEMVINETAPNKIAPKPNTDGSIGLCLRITETSPNVGVIFHVDSSSNSGASTVCETDNYIRTEGNNDCLLKQDGDVSVVHPSKSSKRRKCSELVEEANSDNLSLTSRDLPQTRSSSRRRSQFPTVETKWQKKHQRNVAAKEERRKAIEEFDRLQDESTSNCCTDSTINSGFNQDKTFIDSESVALIENGRVQCLEEGKAIGKVEMRPMEEETAGRFQNQQTEAEDEIDKLKEQSMTTTAVESASQPSSILCVPDSVEENQSMEKMNEMDEGQDVQQTCAEKIAESFENKSVKDSFKSNELFSDNRRSDVLSTENVDTPLPFAHRVKVLENPKATDNASIQERQLKNAVTVADGILPKSNGKGKTSSLEGSDIQAGEKKLCVTESTLSDSLRTTDSISTEESQLRDSMAAPVEPLHKSKLKRKRKTFSLEASVRAEEKMNNSSFLQTDSIDIEQVIGEAVLGMLGKAGARTDDDLSTQDIEMHEAVWMSGQTAKGNSPTSCAVSTVASLVGHRQCMSPAVETRAMLVDENEGAEAREGKLENEQIKGVTGEEAVDNVEVVQELLVDDSSEFLEEIKEDTRTLIESSCANAEIQAHRKSECIVVRTDDSSPAHSNSYSLLQPPTTTFMDENKSCAEPLLKDSSATIHIPTSSSRRIHICFDSYYTRDESLPDIESDHFVEPTDLKSDELNETKSLSNLDSAINKAEREVNSEVAMCPVDYLNVKRKTCLENQSEVQNGLNLAIDSLPRSDPHFGSDFISENEQNLGRESSAVGESPESVAHQLSSTCEPVGQTEEIHVTTAESIIEDNKEIEERVTFVNVAEKNEGGESDDSDDEITSPVSRANLTSSGNLSSESEMLTTQQRQDLEVEVKTMEEEIARLQAELTNDAKTSTDKLDVPVVASEISDSDQEAKEPDPELPASSGTNGVKPNDCDNFEEGLIEDNPENGGLMIIQDSPKNLIGVQTAECKVDDLKAELKQCQPAMKDFDESSSDADLFGSQMSDIVAIPQTPTPTKDKTPRTRFSNRGMLRDGERKETPRSPTPPPPPVIHKKEKKSLNDVEYANEAKRLRLSHAQDHRTLPEENHQKINRNFYRSNDESKTSLKSLDRQGNYSGKVKENLRLVDEGVAAFPTTPESKGSSSFVATTGKKSRDIVCAPSTSSVLRECSSQLTKEKRLGSPFPQKKNWILVASGINRISEMPLVDDFVRKLGCRFLQKFTNGTTHVLVKPVKEGSRRCQRTLKYFQGIANRSWVVSIEWIIDSIRMGCLQSEDKYEITGDVAVNEDHFGPTNARLSGVQLLRKFEICCLGAFDDLTRDDLRGLAETCGASSLQDPAMFSFDVDRAQVIIVEGSSSDTGLQQFKKLYKKFSVPIVAKEWLLDSVGTYDVKSLDEYAIYPPLSS